MPMCSVFGCSEPNGHRFPNRKKSPKRFASWLEFCKRKSFQPGQNARICSKHFLEIDFDESSVLKKKLLPNSREPNLKKGVVPSVNIELLVPKKKKTRKSCTPNKIQTSHVAEIFNPFIYHENINENKKCEIGIQCELGNETIKDNDDQNFYSGDECMNISNEIPFEPLNYSFERVILQNENNAQNESSFNFNKNKCFIVYWSCLTELFKTCRSCKCSVTKHKLICKDALLIVITTCKMGHILKWSSQPQYEKLPVGNVLITSSLTMSGINFDSFIEFCTTLNLNIFTRTIFDRYINRYFTPVINFVWYKKQKKILEKVRNSNDMPRLAGDCQIDSPGFHPKFVTYSIMDLKKGNIIDFSIMQRDMENGDLEKSACNYILNDLIKNKKINIKLFLTDRHVGIRSMMKKEFPNILHEFDVWHLSKVLLKKFKTVDENKYPELIEWKKSIINHMWYSTQTCNGDGEVLITKFTSILHHIKNEHQWQTEKGQMTCEHEKIPEEVHGKNKWIHPHSESYNVLKKILTDKRFLNDLQYASNYKHIQKLDSYHIVRLKYIPKCTNFQYNDMVLRTKLAIMDHNANLNEEQIEDKPQFSKATSLVKNKFTKFTNRWKIEIMEEVEKYCTNKNIDEINSAPMQGYNIEVPDCNASIPKPSQ